MTNDHGGTITIRQFGSTWRASVPVRLEYGQIAGVMGTQTKEGPWIGGEGPTPEDALAKLYTNIGRVMVSSVQPESEDP